VARLGRVGRGMNGGVARNVVRWRLCDCGKRYATAPCCFWRATRWDQPLYYTQTRRMDLIASEISRNGGREHGAKDALQERLNLNFLFGSVSGASPF